MMWRLEAVAMVGVAWGMSWKQRPVEGGPKVSGHATAGVGETCVYLFGGLTGSAGSPCTDELWKYEDGWSKCDHKGPGPRMYAGMAAASDGGAYLAGGWDPGEKGSGGEFLSDVWRLEEPTGWERMADLPFPVSRHTLTAVESKEGPSKLVLHAFRGDDESVLVLDPDERVFVPTPTSGDAPAGLSMCAACCVGPDLLLIFGGSTREQRMSADAYVLDTADWRWTKLDVEGGPAPRASSVACATHGGALVFGGAGIAPEGYQGGAGLQAHDEVWRLDLSDGLEGGARWTRLDVTGPAPRLAASLVTIPGNKETLLLAGGWNPSTKETFADEWHLAL